MTMYEIDAPPPRPRPFWQKPIGLLYLGLFPAVVAVNYVSDRVTDLFKTADRVVALEKEVEQLKRQVSDRGLPTPAPAVPASVEPGPAPAISQAVAPVLVHTVPAVQPLPRLAPPVPVVQRGGKAAAAVAVKAESAELDVTVAKADEIPEPGKFTLLSDQQQIASVKSAFKLSGDR